MVTFKFSNSGRKIAKSDLVDLGLALGAPIDARQGVLELRRRLEAWVTARRKLEEAASSHMPPADVPRESVAVEVIQRRVLEVEALAGDPERMHAAEDKLHQTVLELIATSEPCNAGELARAALETLKIKGTRHCA